MRRSSFTWLALVLLLTAMPVWAVQFGFQNIPGGDTIGDSIAGQFAVDITDAGGGKVLFKFVNAGPTASLVGQIYWDDDPSNVLSGSPTFDPTTTSAMGVEFVVGMGNLPQGMNIGFDATDTVAFNSMGSSCMGSACGIDPGEMLGVLFSGNAASATAALNSSTLRIGLHVQAIAPSGQSDAYVNTVPEPSTTILVGLGLIGVALWGRKKLRK